MLKNRPLSRTAALITLVGLAFLSVQVQCKHAPTKDIQSGDAHQRFDDELKDLFKDNEMSRRVSMYLDKVPSSHRSRAHASRCGALKLRSHLSLDGSGNTGRLFGGHFGMHILGDLLHIPMIDPPVLMADPDSHKEDGRSSKAHEETKEVGSKGQVGNVKSGPPGNSTIIQTREAGSYDNNLKDVLAIIIMSSDPDCEACAPCPTKPNCVPCPEVFCDSCPPCPITSLCPPPKPDQKCPPKPVCDKCDETGATSTTKAPSKTTRYPKRSGAAKGRTTKKTAANSGGFETAEESDTPATTTTKKPSRSTTKKSPATTTTKKSSASTTTKKSSATTTLKPSKTTTKSSESHEGVLSGKFDKRVTKTTNTTTSKTSKDGSVTVVKTTSVISNITGSWMFDKNIVRLIKNETMREHFIKMIEEIPEFAGGEEMNLANEILSRLGSKQLKLIKRGNARAFTYATSKNNAKEIIGHIMDRVVRKKCSCPQCPVAPLCNCTKPECLDKKKTVCPPCKQYAPPNCPAPEGCKEWPPCKKCKKNKIDDPDDDGDDPKMLDDQDTVNPLKDDELKKPKKCKGLTCAFEKTCGQADLNPLTPKGSQSGYMVGGVDEVYGEWPHFVRVDINLKEQHFKGLCGGVLISNRHVLTAGHCVVEPYDEKTPIKKISAKSFKIVLADHDKDKKDKFEVTRSVSSVCYSKNFNDPNFEGSRYDFALLTLAKNVTFNEHIQPACLPYQPLSEKAKCFVVGLGITKYAKAQSQFATRIQKMPVARASCKNWGIKHTDRSRHCFTKANAPGDTCGGDSGGPIVCLSKKKRWTVSGLVSYGSQSCDGSESAGWVGVYTRVQALLPQMNQDCNL